MTIQSVPVPVASVFPIMLGTCPSNTAEVRASVTNDIASSEAHSLSGRDTCKRMLIVPGGGLTQGGSPILSAFLSPIVATHLTDSPSQSSRRSTYCAKEQLVRKPTPCVSVVNCFRRSSKKRLTCSPHYEEYVRG